MKIALITHNIIKGNGQGRANYELVLHALKKGHSVTMYGDRVAPELVEAGAILVPIYTRLHATDLTYVIEFALKADRLLKKSRHEFDILHGCGHTINLPQDISTTQFVHTAWLKHPQHMARQEKSVNASYQWLYTVVSSWLEKRVYAKARKIVAVSEQIRTELEQSGVAPEKISVTRNGADLDEFKPGVVDRAALQLPPDVPLALFVGDIRSRRKNLDSVLAALAKVPGVHLAVGGTLTGSSFPAMAEAFGIADRVHFLGFRRDVADLMRASDVFVFPSRYEACALVLMEALASGLPVITAKSTGGAEVITPDAGVRLDEPSDIDGLADALRSLMQSKSRRQEMGEAARAIALTNSWDSIGEAYMARYRELVGE